MENKSKTSVKHPETKSNQEYIQNVMELTHILQRIKIPESLKKKSNRGD